MFLMSASDGMLWVEILTIYDRIKTTQNSYCGGELSSTLVGSSGQSNN